MRVNAIVAGVGMTPFGKHLDKSIKWLGGQPALEAIQDAGISPAEIEAAYVGNCAAGLVTGQESIRGQVVLSSIGLGKFPIINICLLYTSPSPRDRTRSRMPSSA